MTARDPKNTAQATRGSLRELLAMPELSVIGVSVISWCSMLQCEGAHRLSNSPIHRAENEWEGTRDFDGPLPGMGFAGPGAYFPLIPARGVCSGVRHGPVCYLGYSGSTCFIR